MSIEQAAIAHVEAYEAWIEDDAPDGSEGLAKVLATRKALAEAVHGRTRADAAAHGSVDATQAHADQPAKAQFVARIGTFESGYHLYGPFASLADATTYMRGRFGVWDRQGEVSWLLPVPPITPDEDAASTVGGSIPERRAERDVATATERPDDSAMLDFLEAQYGTNLINDDAGHWAISDSGFQPVPPNDGFTEPVQIMSFVEPEDWCTSLRAAIRRAMADQEK